MLKYGSDIKEAKLVTASPLLLVLMDVVASVIGMSFFSYVLGFILKFSRIALSGKCLQLDSKSDLTTNGFFLGFSVGKWLLFLTLDLYGLKFAKNAQLLFFLTISNFFDV